MKHFLFTMLLAVGGTALIAPDPADAQYRTAPGVIFVANGSGDSTLLTENLREVVSFTRAPFRIDTTRWTCYGGPKQDHNHIINHRKYGALMAARVQMLRAQCPSARVFLMGHSSGTAVVLAAAESLPPHSVERVVLLAPSVSCVYDLRQAVRATCSGIDVYYNRQDGLLDIVMDNLGTADCLRGVPAAGQIGFRVPPPQTPDAQLYGLVRQYGWDGELYACTGNCGKHSGACAYGFLRMIAIPNMLSLPN